MRIWVEYVDSLSISNEMSPVWADSLSLLCFVKARFLSSPFWFLFLFCFCWENAERGKSRVSTCQARHLNPPSSCSYTKAWWWCPPNEKNIYISFLRIPRLLPRLLFLGYFSLLFFTHCVNMFPPSFRNGWHVSNFFVTFFFFPILLPFLNLALTGVAS